MAPNRKTSKLRRRRHLLGKKSWNVYNADNIARVRRDEAAAKAAEEAEEQRMQEVDAQRRLAILRGEAPPPLEDEPSQDKEAVPEVPVSRDRGSYMKKRKRQGEDDTEFELRLAKERSEPFRKTETPVKQTSSAPIVDHTGHIDLFGDERARAHAEKNEDAERESRKKKRDLEDQYTMRFSNAAGRNGHQKPWYSELDKSADSAPMKAVFANDDAARKQRHALRMSAEDPLVMIKAGAARVRELKRERQKFQQQQQEEMKAMEKEERRSKHRQREGKHHHRRSRSRSRSPTSRRSSHGDDGDYHHRSRRHNDESRSRHHGHAHRSRRHDDGSSNRHHGDKSRSRHQDDEIHDRHHDGSSNRRHGDGDRSRHRGDDERRRESK